MRTALLNIAVVVAILVISALVTNWFARTMYNRCQSCGTLNARRRLECRACSKVLKKT